MPWYCFPCVVTPLAPVACVAVCGASAGVVAMWLYGRLSPQSRIAALQAQAAEVRSRLRRFDGTDGRIVFALVRQSIGLSLRHIRLMLGPTLAAAAFVLVLVGLVDGAFDLARLSTAPSPVPAGFGSGHAAFWIPLGVASVGAKWMSGIK